MFVVEIIGGLGNQMFCYAFAQAIKRHYRAPLKLFIGRYPDLKDTQGYELSRIFGIDDSIIDTYKEVRGLTDFSRSLSARVRRKLFGVKPSYYTERIFRFDENVFRLNATKDIFFEGLWQDETYFKDIKEIIVDKFQFARPLDTPNTELMSTIRSSNSVSLHVRRGDYISNPQYMNLLGGVCNYAYYRQAVQTIEQAESDISWFVFSDDIAWVKENLDFMQDKNTTYINHNKGLGSYIDMQLMSNCKHNIIANSTFSWWGAWLNGHANKKVVTPLHWFMNNAGYEDNHLVPDSWIKIDNSQQQI